MYPGTELRPEGLCKWKNSSDAIGDRTRAMAQPTAPPRAAPPPHSRIIVVVLPSVILGYLPTIMGCCILCTDVIWLELEG